MKRVTAIAILGTPAFVWQANVCPSCGGKCNVYADGSVLCIAENQYFEPEASDKFLAGMRRGFDSENGITAEYRRNIPPLVLNPQFITGHRPTGVHA
jgi:hypothetical protein